MKPLKLGAHRLLRRFGLDVVRYPSSPAPSDARSVEARRNWWLANCGITLLLDVGANVGQYARSVRTRGYSGRIISFEPLSTAFSELQRNAEGDPAWEAINIALGAEEAPAMLNVAGYSESSSILPMCDRHVIAFPQSAYIGHEAVSVVPLDSVESRLLRPGDVVWLKLDVQGYEMQVLAGAARTLRGTRLIEMELSLVPLYEGQALISNGFARWASSSSPSKMRSWTTTVGTRSRSTGSSSGCRRENPRGIERVSTAVGAGERAYDVPVPEARRTRDGAPHHVE